MKYPSENCIPQHRFSVNPNHYIPGMLFSILLCFSLLNAVMSSHGIVIFSGLSSTIDEAAETIKGIGNFFNYLKSIVDVISIIIDLRTLLLFISVSLISMGLSFLGIPKGKLSFVLSLIIADIFWFTWIKSFNESMDLYGKVLVMGKSNLVLCIPFIIIYFFRSELFTKKIMPGIISLLKSPFRKKDGSFGREEMIRINNKVAQAGLLLQQSILNDVLAGKNEHSVKLSPDTLIRRKELEKLLREFDREKKE